MSEPTYRTQEVARITGLPPRTLRFYAERGLVPGPEQRSVATAYTRSQVVLLGAILHLRKAERLRLDSVKKRLSQMSRAEVERLAQLALPTLFAPAQPPEAPATPPATRPPAEEGPTYPRVRWDHVELIPGLELRVRSDSGALVRRLAQEIFTSYGAAAATSADAETPRPTAAALERTVAEDSNRKYG